MRLPGRSRAASSLYQWAIYCKAARIPFFFKRMSPGEETPDDLMIREFPKEEQQ